MPRTLSVALFLAVPTLSSCGGSGEPTRSYCEALCDWATACHQTERTIDSAGTLAACLEATHAADGSCADAESGELGAAGGLVLDPCVAAVDEAAAAGECDAFVGSIDDIKQSTTPTECASQGVDAQATFDTARVATQETGGELCQRFTDTFCTQADTCILGDVGDVPQSVTDAMGGTPFELCVARLDPVLTSECVTTDFYAGEQTLDDLNVPRQAARECLGDFSSISCEDLFAGSLPEACAGAFTSPEKAVELATVLVDLSQEVLTAVNGTGGTTGSTTGTTSTPTTGTTTGS